MFLILCEVALQSSHRYKFLRHLTKIAVNFTEFLMSYKIFP